MPKILVLHAVPLKARPSDHKKRNSQAKLETSRVQLDSIR